jgi:alkylation response protein AidB-like acyl-CoA dehydrogenase
MLSAVRFDHRIEFLELRAGLPIGELPVDGRPPRVALALQREAARQVATFAAGQEMGPLLTHALRSKAARVDAALTTTQGMHELTGARSTANTYRLDRFWRNARTFSVHDATDVKLLMVGIYELTGKAPQLLPAPVRI